MGINLDEMDDTLVVSATDLDIRDLSHTTDSVEIGDGTDTLAINGDGSINVSFSVVTADDSADAGNPLKIGGRGVSGALTALSASNDRYDLLGDLYRRTYVNDSANIAIKSTAETLSTTVGEIVATPLAGRRFVTIQNEGSVDVYVGAAAITTATGMKISKRSSAEFMWGEDIDIFMIASSGTPDVRVLESA